MIDPMSHTVALNELLNQRAEVSGHSNWLTLYVRDRINCTMTFVELLSGANIWASSLNHFGIHPKDRVLLVLPTEKAYYEAFWGILLTGAVPVPAYPPIRLNRMDDYLNMLGSIANDCGAAAIITNDLIRPLISPLEKVIGRRIGFIRPQQIVGNAHPHHPDSASEDLALLQYTSGSTGKQKGVMLTHANILSNLRSFGERLQPGPDDIVVTWLPLYHDMGLIGLMLGSIYWGVPLVAMSPIDFLKKPVRWLRAMSVHRATFSAAPNFAYSLVARKAKDADLKGVDLSAWRIALCGAEPIYATTIGSFTHRFGPLGFRREAFFPAYGLAENTLAVSFSDPHKPPYIDSFDPEKLGKECRAAHLSEKKGGRKMVSVGRPLDTVEVALLSKNEDVSHTQGVQGEIVIRGPSTMTGYFKKPELTSKIFYNDWLRTGDLGFFMNGHLFISGRLKDMIIKAGRNYFAEDLEASVASIAGIRPGGVCVFAVSNSKRGTEKVVLAAETIKGIQKNDLVKKLRNTMSQATGCRPDEVILIPPRTLPKTSSGKLQRYKAKQMYLEDSLTSRSNNSKFINLWIYLRLMLRQKMISFGSS